MSVASDLSNVSVNFHGTEKPVEEALDDVIRALQTHLNALQTELRAIAVTAEQVVDDGVEDLKVSMERVDELVDTILEMNNLFMDLEDMADQLCYEPETPEEKLWMKQHKAERKEIIKERKLRWIAERKADATRFKEESRARALQMIDEE